MQASFAPPAPSALPASGRPEFSQTSAGVMGMQWSALHDAAAEVGKLAGLAPEAMLPEVRNFPALIRDVGGWRRDQAEQGVEDLSAVMEPGIAALLAICANGTNPAPAALALLQEFHAARTALLALTPPSQT